MAEQLTPTGSIVNRIVREKGDRKKTLASLKKKFAAGENVLNGTGNSPYVEYLLKIIFPQLIEGKSEKSITNGLEHSLGLFLINHEGLALALALQKFRTDTFNLESDNKANILLEIDKILSELGVKHLVLGLLVKKK
jgi:hypothetical protein